MVALASPDVRRDARHHLHQRDVALGSLCRMGVYTMMTVTALALGTLTMAAHQVALQVFWTLTYFTIRSSSRHQFHRQGSRTKADARAAHGHHAHGTEPRRGVRHRRGRARRSTFAVGVFTADLELQALIRTITPLMGLSRSVLRSCSSPRGCSSECGTLQVPAQRALPQLRRPGRRALLGQALVRGVMGHLDRRAHEPDAAHDAARRA